MRGLSPHLPGYKGGGVTPSLKKRVRGGRGHPPPPHGREPAPFLHDQSWYFSWNHRRGVWFLVVFRQRGRRARPGPEWGGGAPHLLRHMGGGVIPSLKKRERGGRGHPLPARIISQHRNTVTNTTTFHETEGKRPARGKSDLYRRRYRFCRGDGSFHYRKSLRHPDL